MPRNVMALCACVWLSLAANTFTAEPKYDSQIVELVEKLSKVLPSGWSVSLNTTSIHIQRDEPLLLIRADGLPNPPFPGILDTPERGHYLITFVCFEKFLSVTDVQRLRNENEAREKTIYAFQNKLSDIPTKRGFYREVDMGPSYYRPRSDLERRKVAEFKDYWDKTPKHELPNVYFKERSFKLDGTWHYEQPVDRDEKVEVENVRKQIEQLVQKYE